MSDTTCSVVEDGELCGRQHKARGMCTLHYARFRRNGDPAVVSDRKKRKGWDRTCSVVEDGEICGGPHASRGLCSRHYSRFKRYGDPLGKPAERVLPTCFVVEDGVRCGDKHEAKGMCVRHYTRFQKYGDPLARHGTPRGAVLEYVAGLDEMEFGDECALWPFSKNPGGYGQFMLDGKLTVIHRYVLELLVGPPPEEGMHAAHGPHDVCGNRHCFNPNHLRWATASENALDKIDDRTTTVGETNPMAKLTEDDIRAIRASQGETLAVIAARFGVTVPTISVIRSRKTWAHVE